MVAAAGRLTDLIVIGRPSGEAEAPLAATLDAALFDTGRPVLVASPTAARVMAGRVALAWNGSAQAARVVAAALPILEVADHVTVLTVGTIDSVATAQELIAYLGRHDVRASHEFDTPWRRLDRRLAPGPCGAEPRRPAGHGRLWP